VAHAQCVAAMHKHPTYLLIWGKVIKIAIWMSAVNSDFFSLSFSIHSSCPEFDDELNDIIEQIKEDFPVNSEEIYNQVVQIAKKELGY